MKVGKFQVVVIAALLALPAQAQDAGAWGYARDERSGLEGAILSYAGGQGLIVRCAEGNLTVAIVGLPPRSEPNLKMTVSRPGRPTQQQFWTAHPGGVWTASNAGQAARMLRGGGPVEVGSVDVTPPLRVRYEMPAEHEALDRVIAACGRAVEDPRDQLPSGDDFIADLDWASRIAGRVRPRPRDPDAMQAEVSCVVVAGSRLADCRVEQELPPGSDYGQRIAAAAEGQRINLKDADAAVGSIVHFVTTAGTFSSPPR